MAAPPPPVPVPSGDFTLYLAMPPSPLFQRACWGSASARRCGRALSSRTAWASSACGCGYGHGGDLCSVTAWEGSSCGGGARARALAACDLPSPSPSALAASAFCHDYGVHEGAGDLYSSPNHLDDCADTSSRRGARISLSPSPRAPADPFEAEAGALALALATRTPAPLRPTSVSGSSSTWGIHGGQVASFAESADGVAPPGPGYLNTSASGGYAGASGGRALAPATRTTRLLRPAAVSGQSSWGTHASTSAISLSGIRQNKLSHELQKEMCRPFCAPNTPLWGMSHQRDVPRFHERAVQAASKDAADGDSSKTDDKGVLYGILFACVAVKVYSTTMEKLPKVMDKLSKFPLIARLIEYLLPLWTLLSFVKAIYEAVKLAKEITELIKYYQKSKEKVATDVTNKVD